MNRSKKNEYKISCVVESDVFQLVEGFKRTKISSTNCLNMFTKFSSFFFGRRPVKEREKSVTVMHVI